MLLGYSINSQTLEFVYLNFHSACTLQIKFAQGLSSMGHPYLTEEQFSLLCEHYADPKRKDYICWKKFLQDVDQG